MWVISGKRKSFGGLQSSTWRRALTQIVSIPNHLICFLNDACRSNPHFPKQTSSANASLCMTFKVSCKSKSAIGFPLFPPISGWMYMPPNPEINCFSVVCMISSLSSSTCCNQSEGKLTLKGMIMLFWVHRFWFLSCQYELMPSLFLHFFIYLICFDSFVLSMKKYFRVMCLILWVSGQI